MEKNQMLNDGISISSEQIAKFVKIGSEYCEQGKYSSALIYFNIVLDVRRNKYGDSHPDTAYAYSNIGTVYKAIEDDNKAFEYYNKAVKILEKYDNAYYDAAILYLNMGELCFNHGDYNKSIDFYNNALLLIQRCHDYDDLDLAVIYNNIGLGYNALNDKDKALDYWSMAVEIYEKLDNAYSDVATLYTFMGEVFFSRNEYNKALLLFNKALMASEKNTDLIDLDLATSYNNIGMVYKELGDKDKTLDFWDKAVDIYEKYNDYYSQAATLCDDIGHIFVGSGDNDKALLYYKKALSLRGEGSRNNSSDIIQSYNNIGFVFLQQKLYNYALEWFSKSLTLLNGTRENEDKAATYYHIGLTYFSQKEYTKAYEYYKKSHNIFDGIYGANNPTTKHLLESMNNAKAFLSDC